ncbi:unnamed protein product [Lymnaea stagnalis]|uniref:Uncharacterized protein n=1 Tax=Lymnaea stagnalis TaxID=6523 RepID=A0AAV2HFF4_LYMST
MASASEKKVISQQEQHTFQNDELLRSVGTQLNVDFSDYDQWQRKYKVNHTRTKKPQDSQITFKVGKINKKAENVPQINFLRGRRAQASLEEQQRLQKEKCDILEIKIRHARQTSEMYIKREKELVEMNLQIASEIESKEAETHAEVKRLLRKYEKFRGGIATLNTNFAKELSEVKLELETSRAYIHLKLKALEQNVAEMDKRLILKQEKLNVLRSYKDKEYPVKAMVIANLQAELDKLKHSNQEELEELEHIINTELGKYEKERIRLSNDITCRVTEESLGMMHPSLKDTALQNLVMKKEIEFHQKQHEDLGFTNQQLENEVSALLKNPKSNVRLQLFPEFFPIREKCTPDMDIILDIPTQEWLPI